MKTTCDGNLQRPARNNKQGKFRNTLLAYFSETRHFRALNSLFHIKNGGVREEEKMQSQTKRFSISWSSNFFLFVLHIACVFRCVFCECFVGHWGISGRIEKLALRFEFNSHSKRDEKPAHIMRGKFYFLRSHFPFYLQLQQCHQLKDSTLCRVAGVVVFWMVLCCWAKEWIRQMRLAIDENTWKDEHEMS